MARRNYRRPARRMAPARTPKRVTKAGVKSTIRKYKDKVFNNRVKNAIRGIIERKSIQVRNAFDIVPYTGANFATVDATNVIAFDPVINQGNGNAQRIGNIIVMKRVNMRFMINMKETTTVTCVPTLVRLVWFYDRADVNSQPTPYTNANFIDNGNTSLNFSGTITDTFHRYNTDRYRIFGVRTYKVGYASTTGTLGNANFQYFSNNDSHMFIKGSVDCTKWVIKKQKFNDNLGTSETRKLYCLVICVAQSGNVITPASPAQNRITYEIDYDYIDP